MLFVGVFLVVLLNNYPRSACRLGVFVLLWRLVVSADNLLIKTTPLLYHFPFYKTFSKKGNEVAFWPGKWYNIIVMKIIIIFTIFNGGILRMKRILSLALVLVMALSLVACGGSETGTGSEGDASNTTVTKKYDIADSTALLSAVWDKFAEESKFPTADGATSFVVDDAEALQSVFSFPTDYVADIDNAASLMHAMMQNNFTAGAFHVKDTAKMSELTAALQKSLEETRWICGMPDKFAIYTVDDYVVSVYGLKDNLDNFAAALKAAYPEFTTVCEKALER